MAQETRRIFRADVAQGIRHLFNCVRLIPSGTNADHYAHVSGSLEQQRDDQPTVLMTISSLTGCIAQMSNSRRPDEKEST
jgi:hypothetical protein